MPSERRLMEQLFVLAHIDESDEFQNASARSSIMELHEATPIPNPITMIIKS